MQVILPLAGFGKRMRPHTWSKPKPLLNVAGKPVLGHVLDKIAPLNPDQVVFITGWLGEQIQEYVGEHYALDAHYVVQQELRGQAHAIYLAKEYLHGPCLILFVDTLFEADLAGLEQRDVDGVIYVREVEDPRRFGVVVEQEGRITRLIEKPSGMENRKAIIGLYYVRDGAALTSAIEHILSHSIQTKGEYYLADALQVMIDRGARIVSAPVEAWEDCGEPETLLRTNRYLLERGHSQVAPMENSVIIPPVYIDASATVRHSIVGPHATIGKNAQIIDSIVRDAIVDEGSRLEQTAIAHSLIGRNVTIRGHLQQLNVGDDDRIELFQAGS